MRAFVLLLCAVLVSISHAMVPPKINYQVNAPTRFKVNGNLVDVALSSLTLVLRAGSSALVGGYSVSVATAEGDDQYSILKAVGYQISEKGLVRTRRPKKMLEIYEFEGGCPVPSLSLSLSALYILI